MRISDCSSDVCSSDLRGPEHRILINGIGQIAGGEERNEGGEGTDVADAIDDRRHAQRSDGQPGTIGSGDYTDAKRDASARFQPDASTGRKTATARNQNEDGVAQDATGQERLKDDDNTA